MQRMAISFVIASLTLAGCGSPEAARTRGGGPGGDQGNRPPILRVHEGSEPYWETPHLIPGEPAPTDGARHAKQRSAPGRADETQTTDRGGER